MTLTADDFRALARSSPWLWRTLRFTVRYDTRPGILRAFVYRPQGIRVETLYGSVVHTGWVARPDLGLPEVDGEPVRRPDGLVARRPGSWDLPDRYDDPVFETYQWVAMLHPFELADGTDDGADRSPARPPIEVVDGPREVDHHGRTAWEAQVVTTAAYAARCSCCPLLGGDEAHRTGVREGWAMADDAADRPSSWRIRLDRGTGVVVALTELGGTSRGGGWSMTIEDVDVELPRSMFGSPRP